MLPGFTTWLMVDQKCVNTVVMTMYHNMEWYLSSFNKGRLASLHPRESGKKVPKVTGLVDNLPLYLEPSLGQPNTSCSMSWLSLTIRCFQFLAP